VYHSIHQVFETSKPFSNDKMAELKAIEDIAEMGIRSDEASEATGDQLSFMSLPTELHLQIASYLTYPDALSLKHTNQHFYGFVYTGVNLKIEWLIERRRLHLDCPHDKGCELGSDMRFCRGSVRYVSCSFSSHRAFLYLP
jgi:hypothetical protein